MLLFHYCYYNVGVSYSRNKEVALYLITLGSYMYVLFFSFGAFSARK